MESDLEEKCDYILHLADVATRQVTSARVKYNLDHPKEDYPFWCDLFIYLAVGALPIGAAFSGMYLTFMGFFSKTARSVRGSNFIISDKLLKAKEGELEKAMDMLKGVGFERFSKDLKKRVEVIDGLKARAEKYSTLSKVSDVVGSKADSFLKGKAIFTAKTNVTSVSSPSNNKEARASTRNTELDFWGRLNAYGDFMNKWKEKVAAGIFFEGELESDANFFNEMRSALSLHKRVMKTELMMEKEFISALYGPVSHFQNYLNLTRLFNRLANSENPFPHNDPEHSKLEFESAMIARIELIIWARLYNWKSTSFKQKVLKKQIMYKSILGPDDYEEVEVTKVSPLLPMRYHEYFKKRFVDSPYYVLLGPKFNEVKKRVDGETDVSDEDKTRRKQEAFVGYMAGLRESLLKTNDLVDKIMNTK
ncbi:MAG: hypothetical protein AB8B56_16995 [Crocinitomicaceae bacterium]